MTQLQCVCVSVYAMGNRCAERSQSPLSLHCVLVSFSLWRTNFGRRERGVQKG